MQWLASSRGRSPARAESTVLLAGMAVVSAVVFTVDQASLLPFATFPFVVWAAMRLGRTVTGAALAILTIAATIGTISGSGPFNALGQSPLWAGVELAAFLVTLTVVGFVVAEASSRRRATERSLTVERDYVAALLESLADGVIACDAEGNLTSFNESARRMHRLPPEPVPPGRWAEYYDIYWPGTDRHPPPEEIPLYRALRGETMRDVEFDVAPVDGPRVTTSVSGQPIMDGDEVLGAVIVMRDITQRKHAEAALVEAGERWRSVFTESPVAVALVGSEMRIVDANDAFSRLIGYSRDELRSMTPADFTHPADVAIDIGFARQLARGEITHYEIEKRYITKNRRQLTVIVKASLVRAADGTPLYGVGVVQDVSERKRFESQLRHLADHDELTGLYNRRRLDDELERQVARSSRYGHEAALLLVDLDEFKQVNDTLGHRAGDEFLQGIAARMARRLRSSDFIARMGGDEFAIVLPETNVADARALGDSLRLTIHTKRAHGSDLRTTASIGIAVHDDPAKTAEQLLVEADLALYAAKRDGGNVTRVYDPALARG